MSPMGFPEAPSEPDLGLRTVVGLAHSGPACHHCETQPDTIYRLQSSLGLLLTYLELRCSGTEPAGVGEKLEGGNRLPALDSTEQMEGQTWGDATPCRHPTCTSINFQLKCDPNKPFFCLFACLLF